MRIKVLQNYGGSRTQERRILPGIYEADDTRLFGIADYLLENGYALVSDDPVQVEPALVHDAIDGELIQSIDHDEIMRRKGRPVSPVEDVLNQLRGEYEALAGSPAHHRWNINTLKAKIAELNDDTD